MQKTLIISTGGTFNKIYNPLNGELIIDKTSQALQSIASKWLCSFETLNIIGKDSLEITDNDRAILLKFIMQSKHDRIVIIHGTDTMDITAKYLAEKTINKHIVLTGAMVPYTIDPIEATANLSASLGYINELNTHGIYIVMNGLFGKYDNIKKDRKKGFFYTI
ncbi:MAG: asparaginase domain-containing protein [Campylobacterota bacterium]|nr:asparaginase domain-containing protein [Campylobacterota bacterium]